MFDSGIYFRVGRKNVLLEDMTDEEREKALDRFDKAALGRTIKYLCDDLNEAKKFVKGLGFIDESEG